MSPHIHSGFRLCHPFLLLRRLRYEGFLLDRDISGWNHGRRSAIWRSHGRRSTICYDLSLCLILHLIISLFRHSELRNLSLKLWQRLELRLVLSRSIRHSISILRNRLSRGRILNNLIRNFTTGRKRSNRTTIPLITIILWSGYKSSTTLLDIPIGLAYRLISK